MNRTIVRILLVLAALLVGFAAGYVAGRRMPNEREERAPSETRAEASNIVEIFRQAAEEESRPSARQACVQEKLGAERYAALVLNPSAVTAEDQFKILPCPAE